MSHFSRLQILIACASIALVTITQEPSLQEPAATTAAPVAGVVEQIDTLLAQHHEIDQLSGAVLVADGGKVVYQGALGMANSDWGISNSIDTKFRLASITKQFTSMAVMMLARDGKIELEAALTEYLPDYPAESGDKVKIRHLLNHTSGIPSYTDRPGFMGNEAKGSYTVEQFVVEFCSDPLDFEPGAEFSYNNSAYFLLGAIIEEVTGKTYRDVLREFIFTPLEMHDTGYDDQYAVTPGRATGYNDILGGRRIAMWMDMSTPYAAGSLYSTVGDLWKWDQALRAKTLLSSELEGAMFTAGLGDYGFGWVIETGGPNGPEISHSGGMPGVSTLIARFPDIDRCVVVLGNSFSTATGEIVKGVVDILEGRVPRVPAPRGDFVVARFVLEEGFEEASAELARWPQVVRDEYIERDVNTIGYQLIEQRRLDEALLLFEFLTLTYPESANTWDSLGEAHLLAGNRALAIESYERALVLDPGSALVAEILEGLAR
jgi:CubicO group peptidase (beta-lactamase class C family)